MQDKEIKYEGDVRMSISVHEMLDYLDVHPVRNHEGDAESLLKMLLTLYSQYNTVSFGENELQGEELAFAQGILVGMHLMTELRTVP